MDQIRKLWFVSKNVKRGVEFAQRIRVRKDAEIYGVGDIPSPVAKSYQIIIIDREFREMDPYQVTIADMIRINAMIASATDPTGIFRIVESYSYPTCSNIKT